MRPKSHTGDLDGDACAALDTAGADRTIARLAAKQRGIVTRRQLMAAGVGPVAIKRRRRAGRLQPIHRGVYAVGHSVLVDGAREVAALLACAPGAVLSHLSAAYQWRLLPYPANQTPVDITVVGRQPRRTRGIRVHRVRALDRRDLRIRDGIPLTSPARTLLDLAAGIEGEVLERAFAEGQALRLVRPRDVQEQLARNPRRRGAPALRHLLDSGPSHTRSEAERRLLRLIRAAELPRPQVNARVGAFVVDFLWPEHKLAVEVDGFAYHSSRAAFERDRRRDASLAAGGYTVLRVTWRQLVDSPEAVVARIAAALAARG
jgi:very-short-patch-repair endonuclease